MRHRERQTSRKSRDDALQSREGDSHVAEMETDHVSHTQKVQSGCKCVAGGNERLAVFMTVTLPAS